MNIYVQSSKKALREAIARGERVNGVVYDLDGVRSVVVNDAPNGTVLKFYKTRVAGVPFAQSYGSVRRDKRNRLSIE